MKNDLLKYQVQNKLFASSNYLLTGLIVSYLLLANFLNGFLTNDNVIFLLHPIQIIVKSVTGVPFEYFSEYGYVQTDGLIRINKTCSGFIFLNVLTTIGYVTLYLFNKQITSTQKKLFSIVAVPVLAYLTCLISNSSRVIFGIKMQLFANDHSWFPNHFIHETFGVLYFIITCVLYFLLIQKIFVRWSN